MAGEPRETAALDEAKEPPRPRPGFIARWFRRGVWLVLLLAIAVAALPTILSKTSLGDAAVSMVARQLPAGSSVGGVRFSWLAPVAVRDVEYLPNTGQTVRVREVQTAQSLVAMLLEQTMPDALTLRGVEYQIDLDSLGTSEAASDLEEPAQSADDVASMPKLPKLALDDVRVLVSNGPFREPITLSFDTLSVTQDETGQQLNVVGSGSLFEEANAAPLSVTAEVRLDDEAGRVGLTVSDLDSAALLACLKEPPFRAAGPIDLQLLLASEGPTGPMTAKLTADAPGIQLAALSADATIIPIQNLTLRCGASHQPETGQFVIEPATVQSSLLNGSLSCSGTVAEDVNARFEGELNLLGPAVELAGLPPDIQLSNVRFAPLTGAYDSSGLSLAGGLSWDDASAFGLASNLGRVDYRLTPEALRVDMVDVPVGTGQALGTYDIDLQSTPPVLRFPGGPVLQGVTITETLCRDWLKYVSPTFANATDIRGRLGLQLEPVDAPLTDGGFVPDMTGQLVIDGATMQPGPLGRDLIGSIGELGSTFGSTRLAERLGDGRGLDLVELPAQNVDFAVRGNTVYHRGFTMQSGKVTIQTTGAVELENNIDLVARMTIDTSRLRDKPILAGALARPIDFPISGTIDNPKIDRGALANFGADAAAGAVGGLLQKLLDR